MTLENEDDGQEIIEKSKDQNYKKALRGAKNVMMSVIVTSKDQHLRDIARKWLDRYNEILKGYE
jgi:hypothetical protein